MEKQKILLALALFVATASAASVSHRDSVTRWASDRTFECIPVGRSV